MTRHDGIAYLDMLAVQLHPRPRARQYQPRQNNYEDIAYVSTRDIA